MPPFSSKVFCQLSAPSFLSGTGDFPYTGTRGQEPTSRSYVMYNQAMDNIQKISHSSGVANW